MQILRTRGSNALIVIAIAAALSYLLAFSRLGLPLLRCPFKCLTGLSCPGCGSQRAFLALVHGHPVEACSHNLLLPVVALYLLLLAYSALRPRPNRLYSALTSPAAYWSVTALVLLWFLLRNLLGI